MVSFRNIIYDIGIQDNLELILPFLLVFTIIFAILEQIKILGDKKKNLNVVVSLVLAVAFLIPNLTGAYGSNDPVTILNNALPGIALTVTAIIMFLIVLGTFGKPLNVSGDKLGGLTIFFGIGAVITIFVIAAGGFTNIPYWLEPFTYGYNQSLIVGLIVMGLIIYYITKPVDDDKDENGGTGGEQKDEWNVLKGLSNMIDDN